MKRIASVIAIALLVCGGAFAQEIKIGEVTVEHQGSYTPSFKNDGADKAPLNIILMIGDGMGLYHAASAMYANGGELTMMNLKTFGLVRTQSASDFTTDSAASGTAYACGIKTHNSALGMDKNDNPVPNIPEKVASLGVVSGVVSTDDLNGATPAAFFAHQPKRTLTEKIWADLPASKLIFAAAGHKQAFKNQPKATQEAINGSYTVVSSLDDPALKGAGKVAYFPDRKETGFIKDGRTDFLPKATEYAIEFLSSHTQKGKGFFLMVEGARIDKSSHSNDYPNAIREVLDFDKAVEAAIRFAEADGNTLVIISADHETGALTLRDGKPEDGYMKGIYCLTSHTPAPVMLYAYGPSSRNFTGIQENSDVSNKIVDLFKSSSKGKKSRK